MSKQYGFAFEQGYCTGCKACQTACKDRFDLEVGQLFRKVLEVEGGEFIKDGDSYKHNVYVYFVSMSCNHCEDPACVKACPQGAMQKRASDGVVYPDLEKCIGCGTCAFNCPYDAPVVLPQKQKIGKCDFCLERVEQGLNPICVEACRTGALHAGDIEELRQQFTGVDTMKGLPEPDTKPALIIVPSRTGLIGIS